MKSNMKKITNLLRMYGGYLLLSSIVLVVSCTSEFDDINTNKNALSKLEISQLPFLFSKAQSTATNNGWNYQIAQNLFHDQYCQYFSNTTTYFPSDRLVIRMDWIRAAWNPIYSEVVPQLQTLFEGYEPTSAEYAIAQVMWVYTFHRLTDTWGPVPYFNAGVSGTSVPYDAQDKIYDDMFKKLDAAVTTLNANKDKVPYGSFDLIVADVPCSGSGTWACTPEQISQFDERSIEDYSILQRKILSNLIPQLAPNGYLLYLTCSVFAQENEEQVNYLMQKHSLISVEKRMVKGYLHRADSMFAALFQRSA